MNIFGSTHQKLSNVLKKGSQVEYNIVLHGDFTKKQLACRPGIHPGFDHCCARTVIRAEADTSLKDAIEQALLY